jgi:hypothetical protein
MCGRIGPALDAGFFIFGSEIRTPRRERGAWLENWDRSSLTTESAGNRRDANRLPQGGSLRAALNLQVLLE